jgi:hypothetical protein
LGFVTTPTSGQLFVQIQAVLSGDTNAADWQSEQTAVYFGWSQNTMGGPRLFRGSIAPDDGPSPGVIYLGQGTYYWLDYPGVGNTNGAYSLTFTFAFQSILYDKFDPDALCSVDWGLTVSDTAGHWSLTNVWLQ